MQATGFDVTDQYFEPVGRFDFLTSHATRRPTT
jgi:hypothetical protein